MNKKNAIDHVESLRDRLNTAVRMLNIGHITDVDNIIGMVQEEALLIRRLLDAESVEKEMMILASELSLACGSLKRYLEDQGIGLTKDAKTHVVSASALTAEMLCKDAGIASCKKLSVDCEKDWKRRHYVIEWTSGRTHTVVVHNLGDRQYATFSPMPDTKELGAMVERLGV